MTLRAALPARPTGLTRGLWWLVLLALVVGTVLAAVGNVRSHGLAELAAVHPDAHSHLDAHDPSDIDTAADHAHHGDDHSHDKAHALPDAWGSVAARSPSWLSTPRPWAELVEAFRLERPPMV
ncbi:hypothetical protein [Hydrogenophaga sp.]|uniref:hypothetical protein n=1 Tax=Hydrogenophaga sp. TaxID=1904254 RepID=UPI003AF5B64C